MYDITVITPTLGRKSIIRLIESLQKQNVKILHLIMWDQKRCEDGLSPDDSIFQTFHSDTYTSFHYVISHPIYQISRIDNYLRYVGMMMSTTDYITQVDDDCWLEGGWLWNAIGEMKEKEVDYIFCKRNVWEDEEKLLGTDDYESIGIQNRFGYHLMETNSITFSKRIVLHICQMTYLNNHYGHDRILAEYLIKNHKGIKSETIGLHQIVPDFLLEFHKYHLSSILQN